MISEAILQIDLGIPNSFFPVTIFQESLAAECAERFGQ